MRYLIVLAVTLLVGCAGQVGETCEVAEDSYCSGVDRLTFVKYECGEPATTQQRACPTGTTCRENDEGNGVSCE